MPEYSKTLEIRESLRKSEDYSQDKDFLKDLVIAYKSSPREKTYELNDIFTNHAIEKQWSRRKLDGLLHDITLEIKNDESFSEDIYDLLTNYLDGLEGYVHASCITRLYGDPQDEKELCTYVRGGDWWLEDICSYVPKPVSEEELRYTETFSTWNKIAELYQQKFMDLDIYHVSYDKFCALVTLSEASILEIGCGPGNITKYLLGKRPDFKIEGIDISPEMIKLAKQNNPTAHFMVLDCRDLDKVNDETFDAIVCGFCLPYLAPEDGALLIKNCSSLMTKGAILYLSFVEGEEEQSGFQSGSSGDRTYFYFYELEQLKKQFEKNNLTLLSKEIVKFKRSEENYEEHTLLLLRKF